MNTTTEIQKIISQLEEFQRSYKQELLKSDRNLTDCEGIGKGIRKIINEILETRKVVSTNEAIAEALQEFASSEDDPYKVRAYKRAAEIIAELDYEVTSGEELAKGPHKVEGIGKGIARRIDVFLQTGEMA
jgi:DNA polymerase/3'-5' exonuclease PolX